MDESYSRQLMIGLGVAFIILPSIAVSFRIWAKSLGRKGLAGDDYLIFLALAFAIACCIVQLIAAIRGQLGQHQTDAPDGQPILDDARFLIYEKCKFAGQMLAVIGLGFTKSSILVFYMNIFSTKRFRVAAQVMLAIVAAWTVSFFFSNLFTCYPITALVEEFYHNHCQTGSVSMWYASCFSDIIVDFMILVLPIPVVLRLQLPLKQRLAVLGMFLLGATVCAISITRLVFYFKVNAVFRQHYNDETYYTSPIFFWTNIELSLAVVSACLPTLRPIWIFLKGAPGSSKVSIGMKSYSGFGSSYNRKHQPLSDLFNDQENVNLTMESRVDTHIQAGQPKTPVKPERNVIAVEENIYSISDSRGYLSGDI